MAKRKFTPREVDRVKVEPGRAQTVYIDTHKDAPRGFAVRVRAGGGKSFVVLRTIRGGRRVWVTIGPANGVGLDSARRAAEAITGEIALGKDPVEEARASRRKLLERKMQEQQDADEWTVVDLLEAYVAARRDGLSVRTVEEYEAHIRRDLKGEQASRPGTRGAKHRQPSALAIKLARDVVRDDVRTFVAHLGRYAPTSAYRALALLRAAFRWAMDEEVVVSIEGRKVRRPRIDRDPTRRVERDLPHVAAAGTRKRKRHLSDAEIVIFWRGLDELPLPTATLARIFLLCGTRRGETTLARWSNIHTEGPAPHWFIPALDRKGRVEGSRGERRALTIPLSTLAARLLRDLRPITGDRRRVFPMAVASVGGELQRATGLHDVSIHDLRRSCASGLKRLGAPPHILSVVLGHSREAGAMASDDAYSQGVRVDEHAHWLERWAAHVEGLVSAK